MTGLVENSLGLQIGPEFHCPKCAYCLHGATGDCCPECGYSLATLRLTEPQIPWSRRKQLGVVRAYLMTAHWVLFRNRRFCEEYARDVDYAAARRFQCMTCIITVLPVIAAIVTCYATMPPLDLEDISNPIASAAYLQNGTIFLNRLAIAEIWPVGLLVGGFLLWIVATTGVPSYFFSPKFVSILQQNRAIALSYYTNAPIVFFGLTLAVVVFFVCILELNPSGLDSWSDEELRWAAGGGCISMCLFLAMYWAMPVQLMRRIMPALVGRAFALAALLPLIWFVLAVLFILILPLSIVGILIVFESLG